MCENCDTTMKRDEHLIARLDDVGEYLVGQTTDEGRHAYATLLYVRSTLNLDAEEYRAITKEKRK